MDDVRLGLNLWSQASDWPTFLDAAQRADRLGYDHVWTWDHLYAIFGDPHQPIFEGYTALAALAQATERVRLGLFVGANMWNAFGEPDALVHKDEVLRAHCADVGRDPSEIERTVGCKITIGGTQIGAERARQSLLEHNRTPLERVEGDLTFWTGTPEQIAETMIGYRRIGFHTFIVELPASYDAETMERLINEEKPMVEGAVVS